MAGNKFIIGMTEKKSKSYVDHMNTIKISLQEGSISTAAEAQEMLEKLVHLPVQIEAA